MTTITLLCLPYAGGNSTVYRGWQEQMPDWVRVVPLHMPARGVRLRIPPISDWPSLMRTLSQDAADAVSDGAYAIFGHSLGALVGLELAHALHQRVGRAPAWLGVSACTAPARREWEDKWLDCPAQELLDEMRALSGTSDEVLGNTELMELVLPMIRADFHLSGTYRPPSRPPLPSAMLAVTGTLDEELAEEPGRVEAWAGEVSGPFELETLEAGHFFIDTHRDALIARVVKSLTRHLHMGRVAA